MIKYADFIKKYPDGKINWKISSKLIEELKEKGFEVALEIEYVASEDVEKGLVVNTILAHSPYGLMPEWINNRIPKNTPNKFDYLRQSKGRLETDDIWFQVA